MKKIIKVNLPLLLCIIMFFFDACKKDKKAELTLGPVTPPVNTNPEFSDTTGTLKGIVNFPIGFAVEYPLASANQKYFNIVKNQADIITFGNELKNNFVVKADGSYDFSNADAFYNLANNAGIKVYGHTLVWHSQQRASYYNSLLTNAGASVLGEELIINGGFENSATNGDLVDGWQVLNGGNQFSIIEGADVRTGSKALKAVVPSGGETYNTQIITKTPISVTAGKTYAISFYAKALNAQDIQFEIRPFMGTVASNVVYQGGRPITNNYTKITYNYTVPSSITNIQFALDLGGTSNSIFIDDASIKELTVAAASNSDLVKVVDSAMKNHIETVMKHYLGKINAWDVINEPFTDNGELRNNTNTPANGRTDVFVWQNYLGMAYAEKAFNYAKAVDPTADLYMNDYNLETSSSKLTAFLNLASDLKSKQAGITGIGTQMHILVSIPESNIVSMIQKMAATGLKVRISELDIRINPGGNNPIANYIPSSSDLNKQAQMYKFIVKTYMQYVPEAQRGGITVWGIDDASSWLNPASNISANKIEYPLLFDKNYQKKPAFAGFKEALKGL